MRSSIKLFLFSIKENGKCNRWKAVRSFLAIPSNLNFLFKICKTDYTTDS